MIDYKDLLRKYIAFIIEEESISYLESNDINYSKIPFSDEEKQALLELDKEAGNMLVKSMLQP